MTIPSVSKSTQPFKNDRLTVTIDTLTHTDHSLQEYTFVTRPRNGVTIVPYFPLTNSLLLVRQYRHPITRYVWQFPAGAQETGQSPLQTARTELFEETGYQASQLISLGRLYPDVGIMHNHGFVYLAINPQKSAPPQNTTQEHLVPRLYKRQSVANMIAKGRIRDGWTLSAYLLFSLYTK